MPRLPLLGDMLQRVARGGIRPPVEPFPTQGAVRDLVESRVGPQRMPMAPIPPQPMMTPPPPTPNIPSQAIPNILSGPEPQMGPEVGGIMNPERGLPTPPANITGLTGGRGKPEAPSKAQLRVLVERLLGRQVGINERLAGEERTKAAQEIIGKGVPEQTESFTNLIDQTRGEVAGVPLTNIPGGRAMRLPIEDARILALQNPDRFRPGGLSNAGMPPTKEIFETPPGSPEDIIGGLGLKGKRFEPLLTPSMRRADEFLNKGEIEKAGYALPKPGNLRIATSQAFKVYHGLLKKGPLAGQWKAVFDNALEEKPKLVGNSDDKDYFIEVFQKYAMNRPKFEGRFKDEFKFIDSMGKRLEKVIAPEAQLAEKIKTPMPIPVEGELTSFQKNPLPSLMTGPGLKNESAKNELKKSVENSKTFAKFFDAYSKAHKGGFTPQDLKVAWQEYLNTKELPVKGKTTVEPEAVTYPPLIIGGK